MASKPFVDNKREATADEIVAVSRWMRVAIPHLRDAANKAKGTTYVGCHANYTGLAAQFALKFPELSLNKVQKQLAAAKVTATTMGRGGPSFYLWHEKPESYTSEPVDRDEIKAAIDKQLAILEASDAMESARKNSTIDDETLERLTAPSDEQASE
jgi:hypothetical protein